MQVFIHNFTHIEKEVKCRGKKFTYPKCKKVRFPNLDSSRTISALACTSLDLKILDESRFGKQYFPALGKIIISIGSVYLLFKSTDN